MEITWFRSHIAIKAYVITRTVCAHVRAQVVTTSKRTNAMLLEVDLPRRASLTEFEGMLALAVPVRSDWELTDYRTIEQGTEGVWLIEDTLPQKPVPVPVLEMQGDGTLYRRPIYRLNHEPTAPVNQVRRYRYLVRYWNNDVYCPRIDTAVYRLTEHYSEQGPVWEIATPNFTLWGVKP